MRRVSVVDHLNAFTKLLTDLTNLDVKINDEDKALILLSSLPDDKYETFVLTLINGHTTLNCNEVTSALVNHAVRKDKESSHMSSGETLSARERSLNRQGGRKNKSKSRGGHHSVGKDQCAFCKEIEH